MHTNPLAGVNYYRLKQVDFDGKYTYSNTISINVESDDIIPFPNPTKGHITLQSAKRMDGEIRVTDQLGRLVQVEKISDSRQTDISNLRNGMYNMEIITDGQSTVKRSIKE